MQIPPGTNITHTVTAGFSLGVKGGQSTAFAKSAAQATIEPVTPPKPPINLLNGTTASPYAGQLISLSVRAPSGWTLASQSWSFGNGGHANEVTVVVR